MERIKKSHIRWLILLLILSGSAGPLIGQQATGKYINPKDPDFRKQYERISFGDKFVLLAESDETNNYFMADFSQFSSRFEKVY
jgi:hypothetical protein